MSTNFIDTRFIPPERPSPDRSTTVRDIVLATTTGLGVLGVGIGIRADDPELMKMLVQQAPGVAASLLLVIFFLKHLAATQKDNRASLRAVQEQQHEAHQYCHEVHQRSIAAIDRNTEVIGRVLETIRHAEPHNPTGIPNHA
jgi:hypothetical protein